MESVLALDSYTEVIVNMYEILETLFQIIILCVGVFFVYMSSHMVEEKKRGKTIPLPWESNYKFKCFDKSNVKYRDGDNT